MYRKFALFFKLYINFCWRKTKIHHQHKQSFFIADLISSYSRMDFLVHTTYTCLSLYQEHNLQKFFLTHTMYIIRVCGTLQRPLKVFGGCWPKFPLTSTSNNHRTVALFFHIPNQPSSSSRSSLTLSKRTIVQFLKDIETSKST